MSPTILSNNPRRILVYSILFLFFFQLITAFIESIYSFGLLGTSIPPEIISVLFFFSPVLLLLFGNRLGSKAALLLGELVLVSQILDIFLGPRGKMLVSGLGTGSFLLYFPLLIREISHRKERGTSLSLGAGIAMSVLLSIFFRATNSGSDLTSEGWYRLIEIGLGCTAALLLPGIFQPRQPTQNSQTERPRTGTLRFILICLGISAAFVLLYFSFTAPNVIARWTGANYFAVLGVTTLAYILFAIVISINSWRNRLLKRSTLLSVNMLFVVALIFTILPHQIQFPTDPTRYPLYEPPINPLAYLPLYLMLLLFPVVFLDFTLFAEALIDTGADTRRFGAGFLLGAAFTLIMVLAQTFTTVYAYIPVAGMFFRDRFWLVFTLTGIGLIIPQFFIPKGAAPEDEHISKAYLPAVTVISLSALIGALSIAARPAPPQGPAEALRLMTYNIQQGYNKAGEKSFKGQLDVIRSINPDLVGLQESDTNRVAGGNADVVRYFADRLDMYSYYGPKTVPGTFGIALLSKYPIQDPHTFYMYSAGEQTATIHAQVIVNGKTINVYVTHLGNGGPIIQQEAILSELSGEDNVIAMGDFNFRPDTPQYQLTRTVLDDAWLLKWPGGVDDQGMDPANRIDHFFVSPGTSMIDARYITDSQSDHPTAFIDVVP